MECDRDYAIRNDRVDSCGEDLSDGETVTFSAGGWYTGAVRRQMHAGRIGRAIVPRAIVIHTTDMPTATSGALVSAWQREKGNGNGAHFLITDSDIIQFCEIYKNANHAGGPSAGHFMFDGDPQHPNYASVGIEIANPGEVRSIGVAKWRQFERNLKGNWTNPGPVYADAQIVRSPDNRDRAWVCPSEYQIATLFSLIRDLDSTLPRSAKCEAVTMIGSDPVPRWARRKNARIAFHATLDPTRKSDPWPLIAGLVAGEFG